MSFLDPLLGAVAYGAEVIQPGVIGYGAEVLRWHKWTSWRRRGTELGAIDLGAEQLCTQNLFSSVGKAQGS
jgi:hypothetical protein